MANTIKLKTGSGSDPSASDLIVGEIAIRTDSGKLFTKKDNGSVAEISGGGGIDDGDKGDITVSNGGDTFTIDNGVVTSAKIADGTIVNADISGSAAIAGSKIQAAGLVNAGVMTAAQHNKLAGIEANATADMTGSEILSTISGENIILGEISSTGNSTFAGNMTISSSDGGSSAAPELDLYRISASPADADYLGQIKFSGESDDDSKEVYAKITGKIGDASSGTEDGIIEIAHRKAGSNNISARFTSETLKLINGTSLEVASNITTNGNFIIESTLPRIYFTDTNHNDDFLVQNNNGQFQITDATNSNATRFAVNSDGHVDVTGNLDVGSGVDVTGNITVSGTVDGRDVATDGSKLDGIESGATADQTASDIKTLFNSSGLVNAQIDASAAIAGSKINPSFTSDITITSTVPRIFLTDSNNNSDFAIANSNGVFKINDETNSLNRLSIASDGTTTIVQNLDVGAGIDVTGNITVTGTVDGVDIATRDTLFGGLTSSSGVLTDGVTGTTQGASDNTTKIATTAYVTTAISNLINGAPGSLDTLNELAAAMNDDAAFSTTVTNNLATKMPLAGGEFTGNVTFSGSQTVDGRDLSVDGAKLDGIESGATADQTASEILTLIKTVDGAGSGLNADLLDGISSASFLRSDTDDTFNGELTISDSANQKLVLAGSDNPYITFQEGTTVKAYIQWNSSGYLDLVNQESLESLRVRSGTNGLKFVEGNNERTVYHTGNLSEGDGGLTTNNFTDALLSKLNGIAASATNVTNNNQLTNGAGYITATLTQEQVEDFVGGMLTGNTESGITVTYQDSDGTIDFAVASQTDNNFTDADHSKLDGIEAGATADQTNSEIKTAYEANSNTNAFTDALLSKLNGIASSATNVTNNNQLTNGAGYITATLTNEQVQDIVGGMVSGNTESGITVTYQDGDGTLDFSVASQTDNNFTNADHSKLDGIEAGATADQTASEIVALIADQTIAPSTIDMEDNEKIKLGGSDELQLFYNGSENVIDSTSGNLDIIAANDTKAIRVHSDATVDIGFQADNVQLRLGASSDLKVYHDGTNSIIENATGDLILKHGSEHLAEFRDDSSVQLFFDDNKKFETTDYGSVTTGVHSVSNGIVEMKAEIGSNHTLSTGYNAIAVAPTVASGVTVTVPSGAVWAIV